MEIFTIKYIKFILILLTLPYINLHSQDKKWIRVDTCTLNNVNTFYAYVESIKCADSNNCVSWTRLNSGGYFFKRTTDGGLTWDNIHTDSSYFHNEYDFYIVPELWDISYPNKNLIIACGDSGLIVRSTDNGETWEKFFIDTTICIERINMLDEFYGILIAARQDHSVKKKGGGYYETIDGGKTWSKVNYPPDTNLSGFNQYQIFDKKTFCAIISGRDNITKKLSVPKLLWMRNHWTKWDTVNCPNEGTELSFVDENNGWLAGGRDYDTIMGELRCSESIFHTSDGGRHWETQWDTVYNLLPLNDIKFFDKNFGIAVGNYGHVLMTNDGGKHWNSIILFDGADKYGGNCGISSIQIPSKDVAYVLYNNNYVYKYTWDNGEAVPEKPETSNFSISPNPARNFISLHLPPEYESSSIKIYSIEGILVYQTSDTFEVSDVYKIDVSNFSPGVYYVKAGDRVCRFIKM